MAIRKEVKGFGMPWEETYGYAQAVKAGDTIYVSGQLAHDAEGNIVGAAPPDMKAQMLQSYANATRILAKFSASLNDVVEEVLYVTDMDAAFAVAGEVRKQAYGAERPAVASTILVTPRLALAAQLIEIRLVAKVA
jgi:enamine deaminase RidA (YjgF/YER057c/UK114 family)